MGWCRNTLPPIIRPVVISVTALDSGMDKVLEVISLTIVMAAARIRTAIIASSDAYACSKI